MMKDFTQTLNLPDGVFRFLRAVGWPRLRMWIDQQSLLQRLDTEFYPKEIIIRATTNYIPPECQSVMQSNEEEFYKINSVRINLFKEMNRILEATDGHHQTILLGDSDMGKSSFALNYYAYHYMNWRRKKFNLILLPLGIPDVNTHIESVVDKRNTVVFLDGLDEDTGASSDYQFRIHQLMELCNPFRHVFLTCRTHFFFQGAAIIQERGGFIDIRVKIDGNYHEYCFYKLYLSPFSNKQIRTYLKRSIKETERRKMAEEIVERIPQITARPILLAHLNDHLQSDVGVERPYQIYEDIVNRWLDEESLLNKDRESLLLFCENLAINLYLNRKSRGAERISPEDLEPLAIEFGIPLEGWTFSERSLITRDLEGYYRFVHRTILEYLFIRRLVYKEDAVKKVMERKEALTARMLYFLKELFPRPTELVKKPRLVGLYFRYVGSFAEDIQNVLGRLFLKDRALMFDKISKIGDPRLEVSTIEYMHFCYIPAGAFWMGSSENNEESEHRNDKLNYNYWMGRYPITVQQFKEFVNITGYPPQDKSCLEDEPNRPIRHITRYDALHFCHWLTGVWQKRLLLPSGYSVCLPSEAEWEKAARGGMEILVKPIIATVHQINVKMSPMLKKADLFSRRFPWGDTIDPNRANYNRSDIHDTNAVGCFPTGASPYGCEEMSGNVWEWTRSLYRDYPYNPDDGRENLRKPGAHILRGGSYAYPPDFIRCSDRFCDSPAYRLDLLGFRICITKPSSAFSDLDL